MMQAECPNCNAPLRSDGQCPWASARGCGRRLRITERTVKAYRQRVLASLIEAPAESAPPRVRRAAVKVRREPRPRVVRVPECHPDLPHYAKGQCRACYENGGRPERTFTCRCGAVITTHHKTRLYCSVKCRIKADNKRAYDKRKKPRVRRVGKAQATCHPDRPLRGLGMCGPCYQRDYYQRQRRAAAA